MYTRKYYSEANIQAVCADFNKKCPKPHLSPCGSGNMLKKSAKSPIRRQYEQMFAVIVSNGNPTCYRKSTTQNDRLTLGERSLEPDPDTSCLFPTKPTY